MRAGCVLLTAGVAVSVRQRLGRNMTESME